jgi:hypothetical protein
VEEKEKTKSPKKRIRYSANPKAVTFLLRLGDGKRMYEFNGAARPCSPVANLRGKNRILKRPLSTCINNRGFFLGHLTGFSL